MTHRCVDLEILRALIRLPQGATRRKLAEDLETDYAAVWRSMAALERHGLVDRTRKINGTRGAPVVFRVHPDFKEARP